MPLLKSEKARLELSSRQRGLSVRERSALFLADGIRSFDELVLLLQGDVGMVQKLMTEGYLMPAKSLGKPAAVLPVDFAASQPAPSLFKTSSSFPLARPAPSSVVLQAQPVTLPGSSSDTFEGKRSLATTRMFLFDIVERMFVRKMPELANSLRDQLRGAKDRESMLETARDIIANVKEIAGADRADGLSQRLAMMLPTQL